MPVRSNNRRALEREAEVSARASPDCAVLDLLNHIAAELAKEYLQLVQESATKLPKPKV
jgi:hypothetical protein